MQLPKGIDIVSSDIQIRFDSAGEFVRPAAVMIVSQEAGDLSEQLMIK